jgi:hypothetical protein
MPVITANTRVILGIISASAAIIAGLIGNVLAASVIAFFSGTHPATAKRPAILWVVFFLSAATSVVAGSIATFAPPPLEAEKNPKIVVTNWLRDFQRVDSRNNLVICRDRVQIANASDISTSVISVGTEIHIDNLVVTIEPTERSGTWENEQVAMALEVWKTGPSTRRYETLHTLEQFASLEGEGLPVRIEGRSTASVYIDMAFKFLSALPATISATHTLRFPDIHDTNTDPIQCK